jgi:hypothetical protein
MDGYPVRVGAVGDTVDAPEAACNVSIGDIGSGIRYQRRDGEPQTSFGVVHGGVSVELLRRFDWWGGARRLRSFRRRPHLDETVLTDVAGVPS